MKALAHAMHIKGIKRTFHCCELAMSFGSMICKTSVVSLKVYLMSNFNECIVDLCEVEGLQVMPPWPNCYVHGRFDR